MRPARVEMNHPFDPDYTKTLLDLGIRDHCGLQEASASPAYVPVVELMAVANDLVLAPLACHIGHLHWRSSDLITWTRPPATCPAVVCWSLKTRQCASTEATDRRVSGDGLATSGAI